MKMGEIVAKTQIKREKDYIYYCGTDNEGNITVCRAKMNRSGKKKKKK